MSRVIAEHLKYRNHSSKKVLLSHVNNQAKFSTPEALLRRAFKALANSIDSNEVKNPNHYKEAIQRPRKEQ